MLFISVYLSNKYKYQLLISMLVFQSIFHLGRVRRKNVLMIFPSNSINTK